MDCNHKNESKPKSCLGAILIMVAILMVVAGLCGYYYPHLYWKFVERRNWAALKDIEIISNSP